MRGTFMIGSTRYDFMEGDLLMSLSETKGPKTQATVQNRFGTIGKLFTDEIEIKALAKEKLKGGRHEIPLGDKKW